MINCNQAKTTPKKAAQDYLAQGISNAITLAEEQMKATGEWQTMTPKERESFKAQLKKLADRCVKVCGYTESWYS